MLHVVDELRPALGLTHGSTSTGRWTRRARGPRAGRHRRRPRGLSNVAKHASATAARLGILATTSELTVTISDDGSGVGDGTRRSGLDNMRQRAEDRNGSMGLAEVPDLGGTTGGVDGAHRLTAADAGSRR